MSMQQQNINQSPFSLINYQSEIEISDNIDEYQKAKNSAKKLDPNPSPQDVLNNMITPRDWKTQQNKYFMQYVSHSKSSRDDVFKLKQNLQQALEYRQARNEGICSIRQQLFSQTFDQIIRQVTINCPERGLLLMRVRDEHKMTLASYQTLYKSSTEFGMKKQLQSEEGMDQLGQLHDMAEKQYLTLLNRKIQLESKKESLEKRIQERREIQSNEKQQEVHIINEQSRNLSSFLSNVKLQKEQKKALNGGVDNAQQSANSGGANNNNNKNQDEEEDEQSKNNEDQQQEAKKPEKK